MSTLREVWQRGAEFLGQAGIETPVLDAEVLLRHVMGLSREEFYRELTALWPPELQSGWEEILNRRAQGTPVAYLIGEKEFFSLVLKVTPAVLVPRPETEILVERALQLVQDRLLVPEARILDIGTGSGAIAMALAVNLPRARITATDISAPALQVARQNAKGHKVEEQVQFCLADLWPGPGYQSCFHLVVANPPYIPGRELTHLGAEVQHEPVQALDGGPDGLTYYRRIISELHKYLLPDGWVLLEVGANQADYVSQLLAGAGLSVLPALSDLAGRPRVVQAVRLP